MVRATSGRADALVVELPRPGGLSSRLADASAVGCLVVGLWVAGGLWLVGKRVPWLARLRQRWELLWLR